MGFLDVNWRNYFATPAADPVTEFLIAESLAASHEEKS
jgi:hypothetical protein